MGGLRGLAARAGGAGRMTDRGLALASVEREDVLPDVIAERMQEAELAERIDRLLRREACREGIDLEGVNG